MMNEISRRPGQTRAAAIVALCVGLTLLLVALLLVPEPGLSPGAVRRAVPVTDDAGSLPDAEIAELIRQIENEGDIEFPNAIVIPGGERYFFSPAMQKLVELGSRARPALHRCLKEGRVVNCAILILGAIGDRTTVPLLIEAYPAVKSLGGHFDDTQKARARVVTHALVYLTGEGIGRSREGSDCRPVNKSLWTAWWRTHGETFEVPLEKPSGSWMPSYPRW